MPWKRSTLSFLCLLLSWTVIGVAAEKENEKPSPRYVRFSDQKVDWAEAKARCEKIGMRLAEPDDFSEFLSEVLDGTSDLYESYWVGGVRVYGNKVHYVWETTKKPILNNWLPFVISVYPDRMCVGLKRGRGWDTFLPNEQQGYICEHLRQEKETKRRYDDEIVNKNNDYGKESRKIEVSPWHSLGFGYPFMEDSPLPLTLPRAHSSYSWREWLTHRICRGLHSDNDCPENLSPFIENFETDIRE